MIHYLNDLALWHRQGEEYQRRIKSKPPVHPMIAVARQREKRTWTVMSEHSTNPLAFSASGESKRGDTLTWLPSRGVGVPAHSMPSCS